MMTGLASREGRAKNCPKSPRASVSPVGPCANSSSVAFFSAGESEAKSVRFSANCPASPVRSRVALLPAQACGGVVACAAGDGEFGGVRSTHR